MRSELSVSARRENTLPGRVSTRSTSSSDGTTRSPESFTSLMVYWLPSLMLSVM